MTTKNSINNWKDTRLYSVLQKAYIRFLKIRGQPREIALGFALGLFVGMSPTMGFHTVIAVFFATLFKWNKISAALAVWVTNPVTAPFIYGANYLVGARVMGLPKVGNITLPFDFSTFLTMLQKTPEIFQALTLGGIITGLPLAAIGYYFAFSAISRYQEDIKRRLVEQKAKRALKKEERKLRRSEKRKRKKK